MRKIFVLIAVVCILLGCTTTKESKSAFVEENLFVTGNWFPTTDSYGSYFEAAEEVIVDNEINVDFYITQKVGNEWPYIELICQTGKPLTGMSSITLDYKCDKALKIKLSQSDFGGDGDNSYAHYYIEVPATTEWTEVTVNVLDFHQPDWAPESSKGVGLKLENIQDIYLVPAASYVDGENASLSVRSMIIK